MVYGIYTTEFFKRQFTNMYESYASYVTESFAHFDVQEWGNQKEFFV
jgi:hypothetical protein